MVPGLRRDDFPLDACQQQLPFGQRQTQIGDIAEIIGPVNLHDVRAMPVALSPDFHQPQNPGHAVPQVKRHTLKMLAWRGDPKTCGSPSGGVLSSWIRWMLRFYEPLRRCFDTPPQSRHPVPFRWRGERRDPGVPSKTIDSYGSSGGATFGMPAINEAGTISFNSSTENMPSSVYL